MVGGQTCATPAGINLSVIKRFSGGGGVLPSHRDQGRLALDGSLTIAANAEQCPCRVSCMMTCLTLYKPGSGGHE